MVENLGVVNQGGRELRSCIQGGRELRSCIQGGRELRSCIQGGRELRSCIQGGSTANQYVNALTQRSISILPITSFKLKLDTSALHFQNVCVLSYKKVKVSW